MSQWVSEMRAVTHELDHLYHSMPYAAARANHSPLGERLLVRVDGLERRRAVLSALIQEHQP